MAAFTCDAVPELRDILGEGEQGVVYGYKTYAIKVVKAKPNEEILRMASDAGIGAPYHGTQVCEGMHYIVHDRLPTPFRAEFAKQIPELITRTIEAGIQHNDYRTNNMMADASGALKFIDFDMSSKVRSHGYKRFDALTARIQYQDDATRKDVQVEFTPEQTARIRAVRPTVEKSEEELQKEQEFERVRAEARRRQEERLKAKLSGYGRYKSKSTRRAGRRRQSRRRTTGYRGTP
jgi:tRNA A-37 threonylcarbamoyl transferase component Bud32